MVSCVALFIEAYNLTVTISPESPTTIDSVSATVDFFFASAPPHVEDFGTPTLQENVFTVKVTVYQPAPWDIVLYMVHNDVHTYDLGKIPAGNYELHVVVTYTHYNEGMQYLAGDISFSVSDASSETYDITGSHDAPDGRVDMWDLAYIAIRFGCTKNSKLWNARADINNDNIINFRFGSRCQTLRRTLLTTQACVFLSHG